MKFKKYAYLLEDWNEESFKNVNGLFQDIEVYQHSHKEKEYKRIHFILNEKRYLCADITIGKPFTADDQTTIFSDLGVYEDNSWTSYFDGAIFPNYLSEAKEIQKEIPLVLEKIKQKMKEDNLENELRVMDFSSESIERVENLTDVQIKNDKFLYEKYHTKR